MMTAMAQVTRHSHGCEGNLRLVSESPLGRTLDARIRQAHPLELMAVKVSAYSAFLINVLSLLQHFPP